MAPIARSLLAACGFAIANAQTCNTDTASLTECNAKSGSLISGKCYYTPTGGASVDYKECVNLCKSDTATLPTLKSTNNQNFWDTILRPVTSQHRVWLGLYQQPTAADASSGWSNWVSPCTSTYRNWYPGEPNHFCGYTERCAMMPRNFEPGDGDDSVSNSNASWYDAPCSDSKKCVCEFPGAVGTNYDSVKDGIMDGGEMSDECAAAVAVAILLFMLPGICCCCCCCCLIGGGIWFYMRSQKQKKAQQQGAQQGGVTYGQPVQGTVVS